MKISTKKILHLLTLGVMLIGYGSLKAVTVTVGTGTLTTTTSTVTPFSTLFEDGRHQYIYLASEITAAGGFSGLITQCGFDVSTVGAPAMQGYTVKIGAAPAPTFTAGQAPVVGLTTVFATGSYSPVSGWNMHNLQSSYLWNGTDNIIVEVCFDNAAWTSNSAVRYTSQGTGVNRTLGRATDGAVGCNLTTTFTAGINRPNIRFEIISAVPCAGTPVAGNVVGIDSICPNTSFTLTDTSSQLGYKYQWKTASALAGPYTANAADTFSALTQSITADKYYYCVVTCINSGLKDSTPVKLVKAKNFLGCYCTSLPSSAADEELLNVTLGTLNNTSTCASVAPGPGSILGRYSNYMTSVAAPSLSPSNSYPFSVTLGTCGATPAVHVKAYIDYNRNGSYADPGEQVFATSASQAAGTVSGTVSVPAVVGTGVTSMRVIMAFSTATVNPITSCFAYTWGETEDYVVNLLPPPAVDASLSNLTPRPSGCSIGANDTVRVKLMNTGTNPIAMGAASVRLFVAGANTGTYGPITNAAVMNYLDTQIVMFTGVNLSNAGVNNFTAVVSYAGDLNINNDTTKGTNTGIPTIATYPYYQDFESGQGGWTTGGTSSSWAFGTPNKTVIIGAASGVNSWVTGGLGTGTYNASENSWVMSPCLNFSTLNAPIFEAKIWWNSEFSWDGAVLQSSIDNGASWQVVNPTFVSAAAGFNPATNPNYWYTDNTINGNPGGQQLGWSGRNSTSNGSAGWVKIKQNLTGLANLSNVKLRIAFGADGSVHDNGFAFDNVSIHDPWTDDLQVVSIDTPTGCGAAAQSVTVKIKNLGTQAKGNFSVVYSLNGVTQSSSPYTGTIASGDSAMYTFPLLINMTNPGTYALRAWTNLSTEQDRSNDTCAVVYAEYTPTFTSVKNDSVCYGATSVLKPTSNGNGYAWYNQMTGGTRLFFADSVVIPNAIRDSSLYVSSLNYVSANVGKPNNTGGITSFTTNAGIIFDALTTLTIDSVDIYPAGSGVYQIGVLNSAGVPVPGLVYSYTSTGAGKKTIPLNFVVPTGTGYRLMLITNPAGASYNTTGYTYPYVLPGAMSITNSTTVASYRYFYNLKVTAVKCESGRQKISTIIKSTPTANQLGSDTLICSASLPYTLTAKDNGATYLWDDASALQTRSISAAGQYNVLVTFSNGCSNSDTINITSGASPVFSLGNDTSLCASVGGLLLNPGFGAVGYGYTWNNGANTDTYNATTSGLHSLTLLDSANGCTYADTMNLTVKQNPVVGLGNDTTLCGGTSKTLDAGAGVSNIYLWSTGDTTQTIVANTTNTYSVVVTDTAGISCSAFDTVFLTFGSVIPLNLGNDTLYCQAVIPAYTLQAPIGGYTYSWSTGAATDNIPVTSNGTYSVTVVETSSNCNASDTVQVSFYTVPNLNLGPDGAQCGGTRTLTAPAGFSYVWNTTDVTQSITPSTTGSYSVTISNGCYTAMDSVSIIFQTMPTFNLPADTAVCGALQLSVAPQPTGNNVQWNTGQVGNVLIINQSGTYWANVSNTCGSVTDAIHVRIDTLPTAGFTYTQIDRYTQLTSTSKHAVDYLWTFGDGTSSTAINPIHSFPNYKVKYTVTLQVSNTCGSNYFSDSTIILTGVGIKDQIKISDMKVYPNPASEFVTLEVTGLDKENYEIQLVDMNGKVVSSNEYKNTTGTVTERIDVAVLAKGTYFVRVVADGQSAVRKLVIE